MGVLDPLSLLRDFTINSKPVTLLDADNEPTEDIARASIIKFNDQAKFSRDEPTTYQKKGKDETYTLGSLVFFLKHKDVSFYSYLKSAVEAGLPGVSFADKGDIVSYLTGKTSTSASIIDKGSKRIHEGSESEPTTKRAKSLQHGQELDVDQEADALAVRTIEGRERVLITSDAALRGTKVFIKTTSTTHFT